MSNEEFVRRAYEIAEVKDIPGWIACFHPDGVFVDESVGVTYRGPDEVAKPVILGQLGVLGNLGAVLEQPAVQNV
jgi:ketosteroid isomerase-like protein